MLLKIDTRGMEKEKFYKVVRLLSVYCTRGIISGFNVYKSLECVLIFVPEQSNTSIYKMAKALRVPITVEVVG